MRYSFYFENNKKLLLVGLIALLAACSKSDPGTENLSKKPLPEPESAGAKLLLEFCSDCHAHPHPSKHVKGEWKSIVWRMNDNRTTDGLVSLTDEQTKTLIDYLDKYAKETIQ